MKERTFITLALQRTSHIGDKSYLNLSSLSLLPPSLLSLSFHIPLFALPLPLSLILSLSHLPLFFPLHSQTKDCKKKVGQRALYSTVSLTKQKK